MGSNSFSKLAFFDIDGTLVNPVDDSMSLNVKEAVLSLEDRGIKPIIISGRPLVAVQDIADELNIDTIVSFNGGLVISQGVWVYRSIIDPFVLADLVNYSLENGHGIAFAGVEGRFKNLEDNIFIEEFEAYLGKYAPVHIPCNPDYMMDNDIFQLDLLSPSEGIDLYVDLFGDRLRFLPWDYCKNATNVVPVNSSKAVALEAIVNHFGVDVSDTYAFGDGVNDIEMLEFAGFGVAMGNSGQALKSVADLITGDVQDDGVVTALKDLGLII